MLHRLDKGNGRKDIDFQSESLKVYSEFYILIHRLITITVGIDCSDLRQAEASALSSRPVYFRLLSTGFFRASDQHEGLRGYSVGP